MRRPAAFFLAATGAAAAAGLYLWARVEERRRVRELRAHTGMRPQQRVGAGVGPLFFRVYRADIVRTACSAAALMEEVKADPDRFSPHEIARFEKTGGSPGGMKKGDEYFIHIRSPWDGPVRVADVDATSFTFVTLEGHLEAGSIRFSARPRPQGGLRFEIVSCARSATRAFHVTYDLLRIGRGAQARMWTAFCRRVAEASGGDLLRGVEVRTFRAGYDDPLTPADAQAETPFQSALTSLAARALNFEVDEGGAFPESWHHDAYETELIAEPPGPPLERGPWAYARAFVHAYRFPDPRRIVGYYDPQAPLEGRTMLLRARFAGFTFPFGVRISRTLDETRDAPEGPVRVWGYSYRTLEGHFERGEITFEVCKYVETGRVVFRIHAHSQPGHIANPFFRLGFRLFGRYLQRQFAHRALGRTAQYAEEQLVRDACLGENSHAARLLLRDPHPALAETASGG